MSLEAPVQLTEKYFKKFASLIYEVCGIKLSPLKKTMLHSRLNRRLRQLKISSFKDYYAYVTSSEGEANELVFMINEVSTNKTDFFREPDHFKYMTGELLPGLSKNDRLPGRKFKVWSAGCSSGEEPYTLAMVLAEYQARHLNFDFSIQATDISTKVLGIAQNGIYGDDRLVTVMASYQQKYMMRGKGSQKGLHRMIPELRQKVRFQRLNFLDDDFNFSKVLFDVIFCRNVIIYFDRETQVRLFQKFYRQLRPGGSIFIGHSETMPGMDGKLERVAPAVYLDVGRVSRHS